MEDGTLGGLYRCYSQVQDPRFFVRRDHRTFVPPMSELRSALPGVAASSVETGLDYCHSSLVAPSTTPHLNEHLKGYLARVGRRDNTFDLSQGPFACPRTMLQDTSLPSGKNATDRALLSRQLLVPHLTSTGLGTLKPSRSRGLLFLLIGGCACLLCFWELAPSMPRHISCCDTLRSWAPIRGRSIILALLRSSLQHGMCALFSIVTCVIR